MKLSNFITKFIFITAFSSIIAAFLISIFFQYQNFKNEFNHYKKEFASWLDSSPLHPLQKITIKKKLEKIKEVEYDDLSSSDKDDGLNIPYLA